MPFNSLIEPETSGNAGNGADKKGASARDPWPLQHLIFPMTPSFDDDDLASLECDPESVEGPTGLRVVLDELDELDEWNELDELDELDTCQDRVFKTLTMVGHIKLCISTTLDHN